MLTVFLLAHMWSQATKDSYNQPKESRFAFWLGVILVGATFSHAFTGLLANLGWYRALQIEFHPWYANAAYQSACWFAMGIGLAILAPMWLRVIRAKSPDPKPRRSNSMGVMKDFSL